jgi:hypothetical protein
VLSAPPFDNLDRLFQLRELATYPSLAALSGPNSLGKEQTGSIDSGFAVGGHGSTTVDARHDARMRCIGLV